jgi:hypothetical protein
MVAGEPIVCRTARVRMASNALPPALRTIVASVFVCVNHSVSLLLSPDCTEKTYLGLDQFQESGMG